MPRRRVDFSAMSATAPMRSVLWITKLFRPMLGIAPKIKSQLAFNDAIGIADGSKLDPYFGITNDRSKAYRVQWINCGLIMIVNGLIVIDQLSSHIAL